MSPAVAYLSKSISILNNLLQMCYTAFKSVFSSVSVSAQRRIIPVKSASLLWNTRPKLCTLRYASAALYRDLQVRRFFSGRLVYGGIAEK